MRRRLLALLVLPLLLAAVMLVAAQAWQAPLAASAGVAEQLVGAQSEAAPQSLPALAMLADLGLSDSTAEEPELLQGAAPAAQAAEERAKLCAAAGATWLFRGPDEPLRPPTALPRA